MPRNLSVFLPFVLVFLIGFAVSAKSMTPEEAATRLFASEEVDRDWFASQGLGSAAPPVIADIRSVLGEFRSVETCTEKCLALFSLGEVSFTISVDDEGLITGLLIDLPVVYAGSLEEVISDISDLPGEASVFITRKGDVIAELAADEVMAVGSTFKLAVLKALNNLIGAGKLSWDQVVPIREEWRSLPSGQLQDWPVGAPITLHTLASLMMSVSDNTATDALIDIVTRNSVEAISPRNRPFLTTREFFQLKHKDHEQARAAFAAGDFDQQMEILKGLSELPLPRSNQLVGEPLLEFEWFFSTKELCGLMDELQSLDVLQINPGIARKEDWQSVSFKGGSDLGAINLTTGLVTADGAHYCVSATWNNEKALDEEAFYLLYGSLLRQLLKQP